MVREFIIGKESWELGLWRWKYRKSLFEMVNGCYDVIVFST